MSYDQLIGLGEPTLHINGFSIEDKELPSNVFYNRHKVPEHKEDCKITGQTVKERIKLLEADQLELYALYKSGEMKSLDYQREWQQLEDEIKAIRRTQVAARDSRGFEDDSLEGGEED